MIQDYSSVFTPEHIAQRNAENAKKLKDKGYIFLGEVETNMPILEPCGPKSSFLYYKAATSEDILHTWVIGYEHDPWDGQTLSTTTYYGPIQMVPFILGVDDLDGTLTAGRDGLLWKIKEFKWKFTIDEEWNCYPPLKIR